ncbi:hypothetical protein L249_4846, partial [Ophiocordyceps polyrhachis-furcata BCC 54312]
KKKKKQKQKQSKKKGGELKTLDKEGVCYGGEGVRDAGSGKRYCTRKGAMHKDRDADKALLAQGLARLPRQGLACLAAAEGGEYEHLHT